MTLAFPRRLTQLGLVAVTAMLAACGSSDESTATAPAAPGTRLSLRFAHEGVLTIAVGERVPITISAPPAAKVSVWLDGIYGDASLDATDVIASDGNASFTLRAPSVPAYFLIRASIGEATAELDVSASAGGFADVRVVPKYGGRRPTPEFAGSVFVGSSCADLAKQPITDGAAVVHAPVGTPLLLRRVPAATKVAIATRILYYANGCVDVDTLVPETTTDFELSIYDRPMALESTRLETVLTFEPETAGRDAWMTMLAAAETKAANAFFPGSSSAQAGALLNAMKSAITNGTSSPAALQAQFATARTTNNWDTKVTQWLEGHPPSARDRAVAWMAAGRTAAVGDVVLHVGTEDRQPVAGLTDVVPFKLGLLDIASFGRQVEFGWTADAGDAVHLAGSMHFPPTRLVTLAADKKAQSDVASSHDVPSALAQTSQLDCKGLATSLVSTGVSYAGCDAACTGTLCEKALTDTWQLARNASDEIQFGVSASGQAQVGEHAEPISFEGTWVGQVGSLGSSTSFALKGRASGTSRSSSP